MEKTSRFAIVISFEKNLLGQCVYWSKYKRKVKTLGEEISQDEFEDEFAKSPMVVAVANRNPLIKVDPGLNILEEPPFT